GVERAVVDAALSEHGFDSELSRLSLDSRAWQRLKVFLKSFHRLLLRFKPRSCEGGATRKRRNTPCSLASAGECNGDLNRKPQRHRGDPGTPPQPRRSPSAKRWKGRDQHRDDPRPGGTARPD